MAPGRRARFVIGDDRSEPTLSGKRSPDGASPKSGVNLTCALDVLHGGDDAVEKRACRRPRRVGAADALSEVRAPGHSRFDRPDRADHPRSVVDRRSEEHTSELQSRGHLVCRLLLEKKKKTKICDANTKKKNKNIIRI